MQPASNLLSIENESGQFVTYDLRRLAGVSVYREVVHDFSVGNRVHFTAPDKSLGVANRARASPKFSPDLHTPPSSASQNAHLRLGRETSAVVNHSVGLTDTFQVIVGRAEQASVIVTTRMELSLLFLVSQSMCCCRRVVVLMRHTEVTSDTSRGPPPPVNLPFGRAPSYSTELPSSVRVLNMSQLRHQLIYAKHNGCPLTLDPGALEGSYTSTLPVTAGPALRRTNSRSRWWQAHTRRRLRRRQKRCHPCLSGSERDRYRQYRESTPC